MFDFPRGFPFGDFRESKESPPASRPELAVTPTLADGTPDPWGEFYVCEPCHAVVPLTHTHAGTPVVVVESEDVGGD